MSAKIIHFPTERIGIKSKQFRIELNTLYAMNEAIKLLEHLAVSNSEINTEHSPFVMKYNERIEYSATLDGNNQLFFNAHDEIAVFESSKKDSYCARILNAYNLARSQRYVNLIRVYFVKDIFSFDPEIRVDTTFFENSEKLAKMSFCFADFYQFAIALGVAYRYEKKEILDFKEMNGLELERLELEHKITVTDSVRKLFS